MASQNPLRHYASQGLEIQQFHVNNYVFLHEETTTKWRFLVGLVMKLVPLPYAFPGPALYPVSFRYPARDLWARAEDAWQEILSLQSIQHQQRTLVVAHNAINQALVWTALGCVAILHCGVLGPLLGYTFPSLFFFFAIFGNYLGYICKNCFRYHHE